MTKEERLLQALSDVGEDLILQAAEKPKKRSWGPLAAAAACLVLVIGVVRMGGFGGMAGGGNDSAAMDGGVAVRTEDVNAVMPCDGEEQLACVEYDVYTGPVMPLTLTEPAEGLTAERGVVYDFSSYTEPDAEVYRIHTDVTDSYALYNCTDTDMTVTAAYPFAAKLSDHDVLVPDITVDGVETETALLIGGVLDRDGYANSAAKLKQVLDDGSYFEALFDEAPDFDLPVTVYTVTDLTYDGPVGDRPTLAMEFTADPERSNALIAGGMSMRYADSGETQLRMTVEEFIYGDDIHVIIMGEDIDGYTLQGYSSGACKKGTEVDGFSAEITRREMTLREFLADCMDWKYWGKVYNDGRKRCIASYLTPEELMDETARALERAGVVVTAGTMNGMVLEDYISSALYGERMLYVTFPVTIPAGETVTVRADMVKYSHVLEHGRGEDLQGYDLMTGLGSVLAFTEQTVSAVHTENVELVDNTFGFDWDNGVSDVIIDPNVEYYWMHVRKK